MSAEHLAVELERLAEEWGVLDDQALRRWARGSRRAEADDRYLAQVAQELRAEAVCLGGREETAKYFAEGAFRHEDPVERRVRAADWRRERQLLAEQGRDWPLVHGTAGAWARCTAEGGRRCEPCRAWQRDRVARNRRERAGRCSGTRSSYDAGCRCQACTQANADGCARWRAARTAAAAVAA